MSQFPQEIIDQVIDHLHDEKPALSVCALVHRSWLPTARLHMFRNIELGERRDISKIDDVVDMLSRSPGVAMSVRSLTIAQRRVLPKFFSARALECLKYLTCLHEFILEDYFCSSWSEEQISRLLNGLSARSDTIRSFTLRNVTLSRPMDVADILKCIPSLHNLRLLNVITLDRPSLIARYVADLPKRIPQLTTLNLVEGSSETFPVASLLLDPALFTLKIASLTFAGDTANLPVLLDRISHYLKDLMLRFIPEQIPKPNLAQDIAKTLSKCETISSFVFEHRGQPPASCLKFLLTLLQAFSGGTLEDIILIFYLYPSSQRSARLTEWGPIDNLLSNRASFGSLRRVAVDTPGDPGAAAVLTDKIIALSTSLVERGIFVIL